MLTRIRLTFNSKRAFGLLLICFFVRDVAANWEEWWTYDGISGPEYWGRLNPDWGLCNKGRRQSPINVDPKKLLYDPLLMPLEINNAHVSGVLMNTGQTLVFRVDRDNRNHINITNGPLAYRYQFEEFYIHYGNDTGSEHKINGVAFPAEIQLYGFNAELYQNMSEAKQKVQGTVGISIMIQKKKSGHTDTRIITAAFDNVLYKGDQRLIGDLPFYDILPKTEHYMTYEGSLTYPGCWESTIWIIFNKPIYMTHQEMHTLSKIKRGSDKVPIGPLSNNCRPVQNIFNRTVRTNINFKILPSGDQEKVCDISMERKMQYTANANISETM